MLADPARTGYVAVALPEEMPVNETLELERRLRDAVGLGLDAIVVNGVWPERFSQRRRQEAARGGAQRARPEALGAVRAALAEHDRVEAQRAHVKRLRTRGGAPVSTLPFLFEPQVGLEEYRYLAEELETALAPPTED